jgi:hypothetical protein
VSINNALGAKQRDKQKEKHNMPFDHMITDDSPLNFKTYERDLALLDAEGKQRQRLSTHKAIVRSNPRDPKEPLVLGVVGKAWTNVQLHDLFAAAEEQFADAFSEKELATREIKDRVAYDGAFCSREYIFPLAKVEIENHTRARSPGTSIGYRCRITTAFDGSSSIRTNYGAVDFACTNGMVFGEFDQYVQRHTGDMTVKLPRLGERIRASIDVYWKMGPVLRRWAKTEITDLRVQEIISNIPGLSPARQTGLIARFHIEAATRGPTIWALHSAMTFFSSHDSTAFPIRKTGTDHSTKTLYERERAVRGWVPHVPEFSVVSSAAA